MHNRKPDPIFLALPPIFLSLRSRMARLIDVSMPGIPVSARIELRDMQPYVQLLFKISCDRPDRFARPAVDFTCLLVFRPPYMGHKDRSPTSFHDVVKRTQRAVDSVRVFDFPILHDVMVEPNKNDLAVQVRVLN